MPLKFTNEVVREMQDKGYTLVHSKLKLDSTDGRVGRALKALGFPAIIRKSLTIDVPAVGGPKRKVLTLWTSAEGVQAAETVVRAAKLIVRSLARKDRFTLAEVARLLGADPELMGAFRAADALDASEVALEAMLWTIRCTLTETYGSTNTTGPYDR